MNESNMLIDQSISFIGKYNDALLSYCINFISAILIFIIGRIVGRFISRQIARILISRNVDHTVVKFTRSLIYGAIILITLVAVLGQLGIQTTSIVAVIGAAGLAIGLALQGSLSHFAAGVLLVLFRPFKVGEIVTINNLTGTIDSIQIFQTILITSTNEMVVIPNNQIVSANIINFSRLPDRRLDLIISVGYDSNIQHVLQVLKQAVDKTSNVLEKSPTIRLSALDASSINFDVRVWVYNENYFNVKAELLENIKNLLTENGINIPYPTMDVNLNSNNEAK